MKSAIPIPPVLLFATPVTRLVTAKPASLKPEATLADAIAALRQGETAIALCRADGSLASLIDTHQLLDWLAKGVALTDRVPVASPATPPTIAADESVFSALARMSGGREKALAVIDASGRFSGIITREAILESVSGYVADIAAAAACDAESRTGSPELQRPWAMRQSQATIAAGLLDAGLPAETILATLSEINNEVHRRVHAQALASLAADGWGPPAVAHTLLVMGSSGRRENFLDPDQDNAMIIADPPDGDGDSRTSETYFIALAERVNAGLVAAGFPLCKGNMMATSPVWRKSMTDWRKQLRGWVRRKEPVLLMNCDTLLDFLPVAGDVGMAETLRAELLDLVRREPGFLRALFSIEEDHGVAIDWLGRLARETDDFGTVEETNVKLRGTLPLIEGARLLAVKAGSGETGTVARLRAAAAAGLMNAEQRDELIDAFRVVTLRLLRHQITLHGGGTGSPVRISLDALDRGEKAALRASLRAIGRFRSLIPALLER